MKPHIKVIQRNGVDIFVTSSMEVKKVERKPRFDTVDVLKAFEEWRNTSPSYNDLPQYNQVHKMLDTSQALDGRFFWRLK